MPIAWPILSRGTIRKRIVIVTTGRMPPGIAWITRNAIMLVRFHAKPHSADPSVKPSIDRMYSRVGPIQLLPEGSAAGVGGCGCCTGGAADGGGCVTGRGSVAVVGGRAEPSSVV